MGRLAAQFEVPDGFGTVSDHECGNRYMEVLN